MKILIVSLLAFILGWLVLWGPPYPLTTLGPQPAPKPVSFNISLFAEPFSLDPLSMGHTASHYLFNNLYRGLLSYDGTRGLEPEDAHCDWQDNPNSPDNPLSFACELKPDLHWSDGRPLVAQDYLRAFYRLIDPETRTPHAEQLLALKNARAILEGHKEPTELGVEVGVNTDSGHKLIFHFEAQDSDFPYRLTHPALSPLPPEGHPPPEEGHLLLTNGPYLVEDWSNRRLIQLKPNPHYQRGDSRRPDVHFVFVEDDHTARRLYDHGRLHFLRRLPTADIPLTQHREDFFQVPLARFDYIGFGPELQKLPHLRRALSLALNYPQLKDLYHALGPPGCPGLPSSYMEKRPCFEFNPQQARQALREHRGQINPGNSPETLPALQLHFSRMGGDDIARGMEWMQNQWKHNLSLDIELRPIEQGMLSQSLRHQPPTLFRRGVPLDRPTCLAALEIFHSSHPENLIQLKSPTYDKIVNDMRHTSSLKARQKLCSQGLKYLMEGYHLIPLGEIHFSMLISQDFTGWKLNELNQLDLKNLLYLGNLDAQKE